MNNSRTFRALGALTVLASFATAAHADIRITEVSAWGSGSTPYATDWFELTNTGTNVVNIGGWQMDDNSDGTAKVALAGISSIGAGESVIFTETAATASFLSTWFGSSAPAGLKIGTYTGAGVGLSTNGDAVNIFDAAGALQARVAFGLSPTAVPLQTFDNAAGLNAATLTQLSVVGVNGVFLSADGLEVGSPGRVSAVPEPATTALMLTGLMLVVAGARRRPVLAAAASR